MQNSAPSPSHEQCTAESQRTQRNADRRKPIACFGDFQLVPSLCSRCLCGSKISLLRHRLIEVQDHPCDRRVRREFRQVHLGVARILSRTGQFRGRLGILGICLAMVPQSFAEDREFLLGGATGATKPGMKVFPYFATPNRELQTVAESVELAATPDEVWSLIGQFGGAWHPVTAIR